MPTATRNRPPARRVRRVHALATLVRQQLRLKTVRAGWERDALIAVLSGQAIKINGREVRLPASRFFFPEGPELKLVIDVDDDSADLIFRVVEGTEDEEADDDTAEPDATGLGGDAAVSP